MCVCWYIDARSALENFWHADTLDTAVSPGGDTPPAPVFRHAGRKSFSSRTWLLRSLHAESPAQHASHFATARAGQQVNHASAERDLRVEGVEGRVCRVSVRSVVEISAIWVYRPSWLSPTAERVHAAYGRARRRRVSHAVMAGPTCPELAPARARLAQHALSHRSPARRRLGLGAARPPA